MHSVFKSDCMFRRVEYFVGCIDRYNWSIRGKKILHNYYGQVVVAHALKINNGINPS